MAGDEAGRPPGSRTGRHHIARPGDCEARPRPVRGHRAPSGRSALAQDGRRAAERQRDTIHQLALELAQKLVRSDEPGPGERTLRRRRPRNPFNRSPDRWLALKMPRLVEDEAKTADAAEGGGPSAALVLADGARSSYSRAHCGLGSSSRPEAQY